MLQTFAAVACQVDREALGAQSARDELRELAVIFDDQHSHGESMALGQADTVARHCTQCRLEAD